MEKILAIAIVLLSVGAALADQPSERSVIAPYRFPPPAEINPADRGRAELYRDQLRESLDRREQLDRRGKLDTLDRRELLDLRSETRPLDLNQHSSARSMRRVSLLRSSSSRNPPHGAGAGAL